MKNKFGERLTELRLEKGLKQSELAKILNSRQQTISSWEHGDREPDFDFLIIIAKFFNVTTDYLLGLTDY